MAAAQGTFERYEIKYKVTRAQKAAMIEAMKEHMIPDPHGNSTIQNVYFDTPSWRFIRASLEKPVYKEKLRIRCYGNAKKDTPVFTG